AAPAASRGIGAHHPARAAAERFAHRGELRLPCRDAAEITLDQALQCALGLTAAPAQAVEIQLVQDHRVGRDQFLALQPVDHENGGFFEIQLGEPLRDCVEPLHRTAVVVLVVAYDEL